jgi:hypothetical protein
MGKRSNPIILVGYKMRAAFRAWIDNGGKAGGELMKHYEASGMT